MSEKPKRRRSGFRFEILVNGKRTCLAGSGKYGVLSVGMTWVRHDPKKRPRLQSVERWEREECDLRVGAITRGRQEAWKKVAVEEGDEITIRVLGPGMAEAPRIQLRQTKPKRKDKKR